MKITVHYYFRCNHHDRRMGNPEKPATLGTQEWAIQRNRQHWAPKNGQSRETGNTGHSRMGNPEKPATLGTQDT